MPTIAAFLQLLPKGFAGAGYRSTDSTIVSVVEGHGPGTTEELTDEMMSAIGRLLNR